MKDIKEELKELKKVKFVNGYSFQYDRELQKSVPVVQEILLGAIIGFTGKSEGDHGEDILQKCDHCNRTLKYIAKVNIGSNEYTLGLKCAESLLGVPADSYHFVEYKIEEKVYKLIEE